MIDTSTIRITVVIDRREVERAVRALHDAFDLASEAAAEAVAPMFNVAVVGATGAVGGTMLRVLEERGFPVTELRPLASARSEGRELDYLGQPAHRAAPDRRRVRGHPDRPLLGRQRTRSRSSRPRPSRPGPS